MVGRPGRVGSIARYHRKLQETDNTAKYLKRNIRLEIIFKVRLTYLGVEDHPDSEPDFKCSNDLLAEILLFQLWY